MSEKRFSKCKNQCKVFDWVTSGVLDIKEIVEILNNLNEENQTFKEALKELKEIGDYQAMRIQELSDMNNLIEDTIDKKIRVLTDAKIKSFQDENEELFGKVKFSIQVLRELQEVLLV